MTSFSQSVKTSTIKGNGPFHPVLLPCNDEMLIERYHRLFDVYIPKQNKVMVSASFAFLLYTLPPTKNGAKFQII